MTSYSRRESDEIYMRAVEERVNPKKKGQTLASQLSERVTGYMYRSGDPLQSQPVETPRRADSRDKRFTELNR